MTQQLMQYPLLTVCGLVKRKQHLKDLERRGEEEEELETREDETEKEMRNRGRPVTMKKVMNKPTC